MMTISKNEDNMTINKDKMNEIFGKLDKNSTVALLSHIVPDPDSLASALGFSLLLKQVYGLNSKIYYLGTISHPQNKSLKNILHIPSEDGKNFNPENVSAVVVLDTDLTGTGLKDNNLQKVDVRIDHHEMNRDEPATLEDIRPVGATCSIVWDYLNEFGVSLKDNNDVATAMTLGIKTDTVDFTSDLTSDIDTKAFAALLPFADKSELSKISKYPLPKLYFETEAKAFKDKCVKDAVLITFVGEISSHSRDVIPTIADRFIRIDGINTAIIMGIIDNSIVASIRSSDARVDVDSLCSEVFGRTHSGGKEGSGGASYPLGPGFEMLDNKEDKDKKVRDLAIHSVIEKIKEKLFSSLGEKTEDHISETGSE